MTYAHRQHTIRFLKKKLEEMEARNRWLTRTIEELRDEIDSLRRYSKDHSQDLPDILDLAKTV